MQRQGLVETSRQVQYNKTILAGEILCRYMSVGGKRGRNLQQCKLCVVAKRKKKVDRCCHELPLSMGSIQSLDWTRLDWTGTVDWTSYIHHFSARNPRMRRAVEFHMYTPRLLHCMCKGRGPSSLHRQTWRR